MAVAGGAAMGCLPLPLSLRWDPGVPRVRRRVLTPPGTESPVSTEGTGAKLGDSEATNGMSGGLRGRGTWEGRPGGGEQRGTRGLGSTLRTPRLPQPAARRQSSCGCSQLPGSPHLAGRALTSCRPGRLEGGKNNPPPPPAGGRLRRSLPAWRRTRLSRHGALEPH